MKDLSALAKALASDQLKIRKRAQFEIENLLCREVQDNSSLPTYTEMLAICKGLHYTLWMQDKLLLKEEVVRRICNILSLIPNPMTRLNYINAMFETLAREWDRLDNWRVDKFMLLTRDFFTQCLHSLVAADRDIWDSILQAIFDKILNTDVQHAVGLKMHMCTVLGEELSKKKVKSYCVVLALIYLVSRLSELPRHHSYAHNILRVIHTLLGTVRRHSKPDTTLLVEKLTSLTSQRGKHFKSLRRILTIVRSIADKIERRNNKEKLPPSEQILKPESEISSPAVVLPDSTTMDVPTEIVTKKRKKSMKKRKQADKRRRLTEDSAESITDTFTASAVTPESVEEPDLLHPQASDSNVINTQSVFSTDCDDDIQENVPLALDTQNLITDPTPPEPPISPVSTPSDTVDKSKRRVSFGKVFRKRFIASQRLSMTPTVKTTPKKGILRDGSQNGTLGRVSL